MLTKKLIKSYCSWLRGEFSAQSNVITTPYLNRHSDHIQLHASKEGEYIQVSDNGETLAGLKMSGYGIESDAMDAILERYFVERAADTLYVKVFLEYPPRMHNLIMAILKIDSLPERI